VNCRNCRGPVRETHNRSGFCQHCNRSNRCRGCGRLQPGRGQARCDDCRMRAQIVQALRSIACIRPPEEEVEWLMRYYARRAEAMLPLFDREALLEAVR
jgi:hypothetical protein